MEGRYLQDGRERKGGEKYEKGKEGEWIGDGGRKGQGRTDEGRVRKEIWEVGKKYKGKRKGRRRKRKNRQEENNRFTK